MTRSPYTAPRDSAAAVTEAHYWRAVDRAVTDQAALAAHLTNRWEDGPEPGMRVLVIGSAAELRAAAEAEAELAATQELMHRAAWRAQRAGQRWLCTARRAVALEAAEPDTASTTPAVTVPTASPTRPWPWPPPPTGLRDQLEPLTRRSNAPNAARAAIPPGGRT